MEKNLQQNCNSGVTVEGVHEGILEAVRTAFPLFQTVEDYTSLTIDTEGDATATPCQLPAFVLSMASFTRDTEAGVGLLAVDLHFEGRILGAYDGAGKERKTRELVAALAHLIDGNSFGLPMRGTRFLQAAQDASLPALSHLSPWLLEFQVSICIESSGSIDNFVPPDEVYVSMAPEIGLKHVDKYTLVCKRGV